MALKDAGDTAGPDTTGDSTPTRARREKRDGNSADPRCPRGKKGGSVALLCVMQQPRQQRRQRQQQALQPPPGPLSLLPPVSGGQDNDGVFGSPAPISPLGPVAPPDSSRPSGMTLDGIPSTPAPRQPSGPYNDTILPLELRRFAAIAAIVLLVTAGLCFWASSVATSRCRMRYGGPLGVAEGPVTRIVEDLRGSIIAATTAID